MKSINDLVGGKTTFDQKVIDTKMCGHGIEKLELRETTIMKSDGTKTVQRLWTECLCEVVQEVVQAKKMLKIKKFDEYTTHSPDLIDATLQNFEVTDDKTQLIALEKALEFIEQFHANSDKKLLFYGDVGTGKSHLAMAIHKEIQKKGYTSIFLEMDKVVRAIRDTWDKDNPFRESDFLNVLAEVDLLILDDLGAEYTNEWFQEKLFSILNSRIGKSTIITTNLDIIQINKQYSKRISDRILDRLQLNDCINIKLKTSYRQKKLLQDFMKQKKG